MEKALGALGNPHASYRCLHVGGTNGKGSVASTWASVLRSAGHRTGLYTSPHLRSFRERVMVDGEPLSEADLLRTADRVRPLAEALGMSLFEASTLLAFEAFREHGVEWASVEVGLGGRLDATNVVRPEAVAITNVAMDHREHLGETLEEIATEKAGVFKPGVPAVTAEGRSVVLDALERRAAQVGAPLGRLKPWRDVSGLRLERTGTRFSLRSPRYGELELSTPLTGAHQATNAALAVRALETLESPPPAEAVQAGVAGVRWPGRAEIHRVAGRRFVFDVAHNRAAVAALVRVLADLEPPRPLVALIGVLGDKDWLRMLPPLLDLVDRAVFTVPDSAPAGRRWDPRAARRRVGGDGAPVLVEDDFARAVARAADLAAGGTVVVTGSCHTVGDALEVLDVDPFSATRPAAIPLPRPPVDF